MKLRRSGKSSRRPVSPGSPVPLVLGLVSAAAVIFSLAASNPASASLPAPGSFSVVTKAGRPGGLALYMHVKPSRRRVDYLAFHGTFRCADGTKLGAEQYWEADKYTRLDPLKIRKRGSFEWRVSPVGAGGTIYVSGKFTRKHVKAYMASSITGPGGVQCSVYGPDFLLGRNFRANWKGDPRVVVEPPSVRPRGRIVVKGRRFRPRKKVTLYVPGKVNPKKFTFRANRRGRFTRRAKIGASADGYWRVIAFQKVIRGAGGFIGRIRAATNFLVTSTGPVG